MGPSITQSTEEWHSAIKELTDALTIPTHVRCGFAQSLVDLETIQSLLTTTVWDAPIEVVRVHRKSIFDLLGIASNEPRKGDSIRTKKNADADELDSYSSLVRVAGY